MLASGKQYEEIVATLNGFRGAVKSYAELGLPNVNKHAENFMMRLLNITYNYELVNLNKEQKNYPGLDLGDVGEGVAFQITSTKSAEKIEATLNACLKYKHYEKFSTIKIFILTKKQSSYSVKTETQPHFSFSVETDILDFDELFRVIEHLPPFAMNILHNYITTEVQGVIKAIGENKPVKESTLLDTAAALRDTGLNTFSFWQCQVILKSETILVPDVYQKLDRWLRNPTLRYKMLPAFDDFSRLPHTNGQIQFICPLHSTSAANYFFAYAMLMEPSSITIEKADYSNGSLSLNMTYQMISLLTTVLFFSTISKGSFEIEVRTKMNTNGFLYFNPTGSMVCMREVFYSHRLDTPFNMTKILTDVQTSTLADLLQEQMHAFTSRTTGRGLIPDPYVVIQRDVAIYYINNIKQDLGIQEGLVN